jgi:transcriptional regulator with XRE-family HTH domain
MDQGNDTPRPRLPHYLRLWRHFRGKTQAEVAELIGSPQPTISLVERGKQPYYQDLLERLAELYNCEVTDLISVNPYTDYSVDSLLKTLGKAEREQAKAMIRPFIETIKSQSERS